MRERSRRWLSSAPIDQIASRFGLRRQKVIFVGTHHKTGTVLFGSMFRALSKKLELTFHSGMQEAMPRGAQVWFNEHSALHESRSLNIVGVHVIRHPLDLICSAYRYHLAGNEEWFRTSASGLRFGLDTTYQEHLSRLSVRDGIMFEMAAFSRNTIMDMYNWSYYGDKRFIDVRFEDLSSDFDGTMARVFAFIGLDPLKCLQIAQRFDLRRLGDREKARLRHVTNKTGKLSWRDYFDAEMIECFQRAFPDDLMPSWATL